MTSEVKNTELNLYLRSLLGERYSDFLNAPPEPTAIRTNTLKASNRQIVTFLKKNKYEFDPISFNHNGFILKSDFNPLSHSLAYFEGFFQYQGVSSQLPVIILNPKPGEKVLDMAAAPGSKSGQIAAMLEQKGELVLNDSSYNRLQGLQANMQRSGAVNHMVLKQRGENLSRLYHEYFDKILLDAPCTALGTYFASSEKYGWWTKNKLEKLSKLQYQLMVSAIQCLKVGGELVYSTCSVAPEENELMIEKIIRKFPIEVMKISSDISSKFTSGWQKYNQKPILNDLVNSIRIWPHLHALEGFFVIKLKKTDTIDMGKKKSPVQTMTTLPADHPDIRAVLDHLGDSWGIKPDLLNNYRFVLTKTRIWMLSPEIRTIPTDNFVSGGILLGEQRLNGWKLVNASAQYLSDLITKRRVTLSDDEMINLFKDGKINYRNLSEDYYVLDYAGRTVGSLYHEMGELRIRLPHLFTKMVI